MNDEPAAIRATFSDLRIIKGRKQAQLILEVPIEEADNALAALGGIPQPHSDRWVAVARLNGVEKPAREPKEKRKWEDLKLSMQASIRCGEPAFWKFLMETFGHLGAAIADSPESAAAMVRSLCCVRSRAEFNTSPLGAKHWNDLECSYQAWLKVAE